MVTRPRVAICQSTLTPGGRLRVVLEIIEILNEFGIVPDILTANLGVHPDWILDQYGRSIQANYKCIFSLPKIPKLHGDFYIVLFNAMLRSYTRDYDLLINTSNSLIFLPKSKRVITYMFFPRKRRIMAKSPNIHRPDIRFRPWSVHRPQKALLRLIYHFSKLYPGHEIVCMTKFTYSALKQDYAIDRNLPIVYPPVDMANFQDSNQERIHSIVTVGRFSPDKRQLEQIKLAEQLPDFPFHIVGFANNNPYYRLCHQYVKEHQLSNVQLHPDAPFEHMVSLLKESKYFLHTLINEPFGLTAVQAIAAGCLPIVHDSGGQRETVIKPELRYQDLREVPAIIRNLEALDKTDVDLLTGNLQGHIERFDGAVFRHKMRNILLSYL
jgi:glycosyltransferase involved in cell wall biosynthesis